VIPELPRIISGFASCYPKFPNKIRVSGISGSGSGIPGSGSGIPGSGFGLRVFCPALSTPVLFTLTCICSCVTLVLLPSVKPNVLL
jgi:hypothetical protein